MSSGKTNYDLQRERNKATFDPDELTYIVDGGREKTRRRRYIENLALKDPDFQHEDVSFLNRNELLSSVVKKGVKIYQKLSKLNFQNDDDKTIYISAASHKGESVGFVLQRVMFIPTIKGQGNKEQQEKWLPPAEKLQIIGTYAQTELGHGTFIRGLETTATYDHQTQEFLLNTPTITALKWWPGCMGHTATHAIVIAQLYIGGKCYGLHPFMVQLRSLTDHTPLPGINIGDIGPKLGVNGLDNGFLGFDHVRIPRTNLLMKYAQVLSDGSYVQPPDSKLSYGTMVKVRVGFVAEAADHLARACTIGIRYSAIRRQTEITPGGEEPQILDYQSQQYKLLPALSAAYAFIFTARTLNDINDKIEKEIQHGIIKSMSDLHALSSGLKAVTSTRALSDIETCRLACGGHGYSKASGLSDLYAGASAMYTGEGENTVLYLQVARYLMKCSAQLASGSKLPALAAYLMTKYQSKWNVQKESDVLKYNLLDDAYCHRAQRLVKVATEMMQSNLKAGMAHHQAWNNSHIALIRAAQAQCNYFIVKNFINVVTTTTMPDSIRTVLSSLCQLYALHDIYHQAGDFLHDGYMSGEQISMVTKQVSSLLTTIRPNAVSLVDAFDIRDEFLHSILGRYDGNVYENMYKWAKRSPLNKNEVHESYYKYLQPMLQSKKSKL